MFTITSKLFTTVFVVNLFVKWHPCLREADESLSTLDKLGLIKKTKQVFKCDICKFAFIYSNNYKIIKIQRQIFNKLLRM